MGNMNKDQKAKIILISWMVVIIAALAALLIMNTTAGASPLFQSTNTPEPTADIDYVIELSTGNEVEISRSINYGQIGIIAALGIVALLIFLLGIFKMITHYIH